MENSFYMIMTVFFKLAIHSTHSISRIALAGFRKRLILFVASVLILLTNASMVHAGWYFYVQPTTPGFHPRLKFEYNSRFACQDWLGYCIPNEGYPYQLPYGACGKNGVGVGEDGYMGTSCGRDSSRLVNYWSFLFYPDSGGVYRRAFSGQSTCLSKLFRSKKRGSLRIRGNGRMNGTFSKSCIFAGQAFE